MQPHQQRVVIEKAEFHGGTFETTFLLLEADRALSAVRTALAQPQPSAPSVEPAADLREKLIAAIAAGLVSTYHCNRVWSAWHVGTMSEDDFSPVDESDTPAEIADVVLSIIGAAPLMANGLTEAETAATASVAGLAGATKHTEAVDHAHELLRRLGYHRDGDHFINVNRAGAEAMHVSTIATIVHAALIVASATPPAAPAPAVQPLPARQVRVCPGLSAELPTKDQVPAVFLFDGGQALLMPRRD